MTTGPVRASSEWLRLREPADAAARASELAEKVRSYLPTHGGATIHDLGCGTGSMARWLAVRLPGPQYWVTYNRDISALVRASAAVLLPSSQQGLPRSVMESLALGVPVNGSRIRGMAELLEGGCASSFRSATWTG
jgi:glycosyltransferase involved in cell wall biosynthesis